MPSVEIDDSTRTDCHSLCKVVVIGLFVDRKGDGDKRRQRSAISASGDPDKVTPEMLDRIAEHLLKQALGDNPVVVAAAKRRLEAAESVNVRVLLNLAKHQHVRDLRVEWKIRCWAKADGIPKVGFSVFAERSGSRVHTAVA